MRPPVPITVRYATRDLELGTLRIRQGTTVAIDIERIHHRRDIYPDPRAFRPQRFLDQRPGTYTWIPFGGGVHRCIGAGFSLTEARLILATILRHYTFAPIPWPRRAITAWQPHHRPRSRRDRDTPQTLNHAPGHTPTGEHAPQHGIGCQTRGRPARPPRNGPLLKLAQRRRLPMCPESRGCRATPAAALFVGARPGAHRRRRSEPNRMHAYHAIGSDRPPHPHNAARRLPRSQTCCLSASRLGGEGYRLSA